MLRDDGVLILPTHPIPAYYHGQFTMKTAGVAFTMIFNTLEMPATHVPLGLNKNGLPIGVQVIKVSYSLLKRTSLHQFGIFWSRGYYLGV